MKWVWLVLSLTVSLTLSFNSKADFYQAQQHYLNKDYRQSFAQFKTLAEQGNANAQIALAQSYALGQGTQQNYPQALAWAMMAKQLQHPAADGLYLAYRDKVSSRREVKNQFKQLEQQFGLTTLQQNLFPILDNPKHALVPTPSNISRTEPKFPTNAYEDKTHTWVLLHYDIDANGHTTNIQVVNSYPDNRLVKGAIAAIKQWRFVSYADKHNNPKTMALQSQVFELFAGQNPYQKSQTGQDLLAKANQGSAEHQHLLAHLIDARIIDYPNSAQLAPHQALDWLTRAAVNGFAQAQMQLYLCMQQGRCQTDHHKAQLWLDRAFKQQALHAPMAKIHHHLSQGELAQAQRLLKPLMKNNHLDALTLYANLKTTSENAQPTDHQQGIKYARQAMALDHDNPRLLAIIALAHYKLDPNTIETSQAHKPPKWQHLLSTAIIEAEYRDWPIDYYVNTLEKLQQQTLLKQMNQNKAETDSPKNKKRAK